MHPVSRLSTHPFGEALRGLMNTRGLTYRGLADATRQIDGKGITSAHINMLANGHEKPSMRVMSLISHACGVDPSYFAEYRLADARRQLDPAEVGLEHALANLNGALATPSGPIRELPSQVELIGSPHALAEMSDRELELWTHTCAAMVSRPARANGAQRKWRHLLQDAHLEQDARRTRRQRHRHIPPEPN
jgi:transcriptional regulator with XRE-family HTH domain